jgi:hypothetical protein
MHQRLAIIVLLVLALAGSAIGEELVSLPTKPVTAAMDFAYRPERNVELVAPSDRAETYRQVQTLLLELDYVLTKEAVSRGDLIGPMISKHRYYQGKLAEAAMVRLTPAENGTNVTIRGVFVVPERGYVLDRSDRHSTRTIRDFPELFAAKLRLIEATGMTGTHEVLAQAKETLTSGDKLKPTIKTLRLVERCTRPRCLAGRQARELIHAIRGRLKQQEILTAQVDEQRAKIDVAIQQRDWLTAHGATDALMNILLEGGVNQTDDRLTEAKATLKKARRMLRQRGVLATFGDKHAPAAGHDVAVGFTALNVGTRPIKSFKVRVDSANATGASSPGRIGRSYPYTIELDPPLQPDEYFPTAVVLRFEIPSEVASTHVRVVGVSYGK